MVPGLNLTPLQLEMQPGVTLALPLSKKTQVPVQEAQLIH